MMMASENDPGLDLGLDPDNERKRPTLLLRFQHGLGDAAQFTCVLKHLRYYAVHGHELGQPIPDFHITVQCNEGHDDCFRGLADRVERAVFPWRHKRYDKVSYMTFPRAEWTWVDVPSSKVSQCLLTDFAEKLGLNMTPLQHLYYYECETTDAQAERVNEWADTLPDAPIVLIHHEGVSCPDQKNVESWHIERLCKAAKAKGWLPVLLHWGRYHCVEAAGHAICCELTRGQKQSDAGLIRAIIQRADLFWGIDSGPAHLAATTDTRSLVVWRGFHPVFNFDLADNVTHLVPFSYPRDLVKPGGMDIDQTLKGSPEGRETVKTFEALYRHVYLFGGIESAYGELCKTLELM